ncbi:MAG: efflux RND transporter periplasmic adaptor subunit, partial [Muribaculaceae bacterium]|nr:efflux RND transporter periplasmic adaptor subunit [Muribaculaceae bacterium]
IYVKEGDRVHRGQLLAELDSADYVLGVNQLRVQNSQASAELARMTRLYSTGGVSDNDFEKARTGVKQLGYQLALNERKLGYCRLYSPADGVITSVNFESGELVDAGSPLFDLMDNTHLEVVVDLPVSEYMRRADFASFTGSSPLLPGRTVGLRMLSLTPRADNNQLYQLKLAVEPGSDVVLTPGMNLTVAIATEGHGDGAVTVPASAVFDTEGHTAVWVLSPADSTLTAVPVTVAGNGADGTLTITSGLNPSQIVVRAGVHHLTEGEKVRVITPASESNVGNLL